MATLALGAVGGFFFGPLGFLVGTALGNILFPQKGADGPRLTDLHTTTADYGTPIPRIFGRWRVPLIVIWADYLVEHAHHDGGKGGPRLRQGPIVTIRGRARRLGIRRDTSRRPSGKGGPDVTTYTYTVSFYGHLCEGPIAGATRIWIDNQVEWDSTTADDSNSLPFTTFKGTTTQNPFSAAEAVLGVGFVPAYRGKAGMGWDTLDVGKWGNRIPNIEVEVIEAAGNIPWRVSTFDPTPNVSTNAIQFNGPATYSNGVITVVEWETATDPWTERSYLIDGTPTGIDFDTGVPVVPGGLFPIPAAPVLNLPVYFAYSAGGVRLNQWYTHGNPVNNVANFGSNLPEDTVGGMPLFQGGSLYAIGPNAIAKFDVTVDNRPSGTPIFTNTLADSSSSKYKFGRSDDGYIYVSYDTSFSSAIYQYDDTLTLIHTWAAGTTPSEFAGQGSFVVYQGYIAFNGNVAGTYYLNVYEMSYSGFVFVGRIPQIQSGLVYLGAGLVLGGDGVISLVPPPASTTLGAIVAKISDIVGRTDYDVTTLTDVVDGYCIASQGSGVAAISPLQNAWPFDAVESMDAGSPVAPIFKFVRRGQSSIVTIPAADLAARLPGGTPPHNCTPTRKLEPELPRTVYTKFANIDADYQTGSQYERRQVGGATSDITLDLPIAMSDAYGKTVAGIFLYGAWMARTSFKFFTSVKYAYLEPTDVITIGIYTMRITKKVEHTSGVIEWEALQDDPKLWIRSFSGVSGTGNTSTPPTTATVAKLVMLDLPLLDDTDSPNGVYASMAPVTPAANWAGTLYKSVDGGTTYTQIDSTATVDAIGTCTTVLGNWTGGYVFDESNKISVTLDDSGATLSSVTRDEAQAGAFRVLCGLEIIYCRDATLIAPLQYEITGLIRGMRGTEWAHSTHTIGERFHLLPPAMNPAAPFAELGSPLKYKGVSKGLTVASATEVNFTNDGRALKCYSPVLIGGGPNVAGDLVGAFVRRTRVGASDFGDAPLSESTEKYVAEFWDSTYTVCARSLVVTSEAFTYLIANQVSDFGAAQSLYYVSVGQVGSYGIGTRGRTTIKGSGGVINAPIVSVVPYDGIPSSPPPPPPGGGTPPLNHTFTGPSETLTTDLNTANTWVAAFTTNAAGHGYIYIVEADGIQRARHVYLSTNGNVSGKIAGTEQVGRPLNINYNGLVSGSTLYYYVTDFKSPTDGSWLTTPGETASTTFNYQETT